ncbi:MAG: hypothetical protein WCK11_05325 [Candidatus Falkowbacteria bacterium]
MSHEIEADFVSDWGNETSQCRNCTSFTQSGEMGYCSEARGEVPASAHCDYFKSRD